MEEDESTLVADIPHIELTDEKIKDNHHFFSEVECSETNGTDVGFQFSATAANKSMMSLTDKQLKTLEELKDILKEIDQVKKLMFVPPHGDKLVK